MPRHAAIDLFCGVGGMSVGFARAGFDLKLAIDNDFEVFVTHLINFPDTEVLCVDVTSVSGNEVRAKIGQVDVVFGGPPCQGFSWIGKRDTDDPRNSLLLQFARLIREIEPLYFVVENVDGMLHSSASRHLERFLSATRRAGYSVVRPIRVLDAKDYGVPQQRKRAFVLGYRKGCAEPQYPTKLAARPPTVEEAISDLALVDGNLDDLQADEYSGPLGVPSIYGDSLRSKRKRILTGCARSVHSVDVVRRFQKLAAGAQDKISRFERLSAKGLSPTLRAGTPAMFGSHTAARPIHYKYPRCITVREAARLHSYPDDFDFHPTVWHGFRQVGNSVPPLLAQAVAAEIVVAMDATLGSTDNATRTGT